MAHFNISQAAREAGVTRQTIYRKINSGKLSAIRDGDGNKVIEASELFRVFDQAIKGSNTPTPTQTSTGGINIELLQYKVGILEKQLADKDDQNKQLLNIIERSTLSLPSPEKKGWLARIFS